MEMKPGYKQTEVGVIPEGWETYSLKQIIVNMFQGVNTAIDKPEYVQDGIPMLKANNVIDGQVVFDEADHISLKTFLGYSDRFRLRKNDFLFSNIGARLGTGSLLNRDVECTFAWNVMRIIPDARKVTPEYLSFLINSPKYSQEIRSKQSGSGMGFVPKGVLEDLVVAIPKRLEEQSAIARTLGDIDALLVVLQTAISKKLKVKQGMMQQLLTREKRLPGFSGDWQVKGLGEIGDVSSAGVDKKVRPGEIPVRLLNYLDVYSKKFIYSGDLDHWVTAPRHQARHCTVQKGDVFFTPSSETRDDIGISAVVMEDVPDGAYSYHVVRLRLREAWDLRFRAYAFKTRSFLGQAETLCDGSGTRYVISLGKFRSMTVYVPPIPEQAAIAAILSDMDAEIDVLEAKLAKGHQLKQGMMQELLTGRTRLV